jgi:adenine-specific DNA-methyltransferase
VSAYPAITVIRNAQQSCAVVACATAEAETHESQVLARAIEVSRQGEDCRIAGLTIAAVDKWFKAGDPWPCANPLRLRLLRRLEEEFQPLESARTKIGIGIATGLDDVYITTDPNAVEPSRLLPLAMAKDTLGGVVSWSGHFLINPWDASGIVALDDYPLLKSYLERHQLLLKKRNTAQRNPENWYRTIDRVINGLAGKHKLYIPDIKDYLNPVLDLGVTYPHHNLYFVESDEWDLEVLGGILLSKIGQFFVECYGVRMRGGYLRFQAQYLRRIRVPRPECVSEHSAELLREAFRNRDRAKATAAALSVYGLDIASLEGAIEH